MNALDQLKSMAPYQRNRLFALIGLGFFSLLVIVGFVFFGPEVEMRENATLEFWDTEDNWLAYSSLITNYGAINEGVFISYVSKDPETYREELTEALAKGEGPDIYTIKNTWLPMEERRLTPMNNYMPIPTGSEVALSPAEVVNRYPDVVRFDFSREKSSGTPVIYALPMSVDTLALYYNEDYFNTHTILNPPSTWDELLEISNKLKRVNGSNVELAGIALGSSENVEHSADILSALMLQTGTRMNDERDFVTFDRPVQTESGQAYPARDALQFYTSFTNPNSENYTWDPNESSSIEAFSNGTAAMMIGYARDAEKIEKENRHLNFKVAPLPQPKGIKNPINHASYWGIAVSNSTERKDLAWDFINFVTKENNAKMYLEETEQPPALKSLITEEISDELSDIRVFAEQADSARSWIQPNAVETEKLLKEAIRVVVSGEKGITDALGEAADKINLLFGGF